MAVNDKRLFEQIKKVVGVQDDEWNNPSFTTGTTRKYAKHILDCYLPILASRWKYSFLQGKYTSDSTDTSRKILITADDKGLYIKENMLSILWAKIGTALLEIRKLVDIESCQLSDNGTVRYGYYEIDEQNKNTVCRLLSVVNGAKVEAVILKHPHHTAFPTEFHDLFVFQVAERIFLEKQKNNDEGARSQYEQRLAKLEQDISTKWLESSKTENDYSVPTPFIYQQNYKSYGYNGRARAR